jgi:hypothetical protein
MSYKNTANFVGKRNAKKLSKSGMGQWPAAGGLTKGGAYSPPAYKKLDDYMGEKGA